jgi:hypothetical protein
VSDAAIAGRPRPIEEILAPVVGAVSGAAVVQTISDLAFEFVDRHIRGTAR